MSFVDALSPEEAGWKAVAPREWLKPDGTLYKFAPGTKEIVFKYINTEEREIIYSERAKAEMARHA